MQKGKPRIVVNGMLDESFPKNKSGEYIWGDFKSMKNLNLMVEKKLKRFENIVKFTRNGQRYFGFVRKLR